jgi:anti-sigma-K factor RskA
VNIQEYISSGIIESYVLGLADQEEREEFERICAAYPEVKEARDAFEFSLENKLMDHAVLPPSILKNKIFEQITIDPAEVVIGPALRPIPGSTRNPRSVWAQWLAAASVLLLMASTALNFYFFSRYREYISKYDEQVTSQNQMAAVNLNQQTKLNEYESAFNKMRDPSMALIKMPGTEAHPGSLTTVYWDTRSKDVYLLVNNLPQPSSDKQYQLWALVNGKPVDAGIFDIQEGVSLLKMKNIPVAQGFAITLERKGGSPSPTLEQMYVIGKITG